MEIGYHLACRIYITSPTVSLQYLLTLKLNQADILDVFNGIQFLPLDKNTFLRIQCFINLLEASFSWIKHTVFLYNDQLVW